MLFLLLKYQARTGIYYKFIVSMIIAFISTWKNIDITIIIFIFLQVQFYKVIQNNDIGILLIRISNFRLSKLLFLQNISLFIWLIIWYIIGKFIASTIFNISILTEIIWFLNLTALTFFSFIIGNKISNSDVVTIKNKILQSFMSSFFYCFSVALFYGYLKILSLLSFHFPILLLNLISVIIFWNYNYKKYIKITFYKNLIQIK